MTAAPLDPLTPGTPVWYRQTCRGGYGFQRDVPAIFVRAYPGSRWVAIDVTIALVDGTAHKRIRVVGSNVRRQAIDDPAGGAAGKRAGIE